MAEKKPTARPSTKTAASKRAATKVQTEDKEKEAAVKRTAKPAKPKAAAKKSGSVKTTTAKKETSSSAKTAKTAAKSEKSAARKQTKTAAKQPAAKASTAKATSKKEKQAQYEKLSLDTCLAMMQAMGIPYTYDDYAAEMMKEADLGKIEKKLLTDYHLTKTSFSYDEDGYDRDLVAVVLARIADTVDFKASDYPKMEAEAEQALLYVIGSDLEKDGDEYLSEFHLWERLLMVAQRQGYRNEEALHAVIKADLKALFKHFMQLARTVLPHWQYADVKYYENFAYALLSQFTDLFDAYNNELMMDVADLYILHEDYGQGDADYGYLIRENQIKDYVYYRFAHVYEDLDLDKAKGIAYDSLQYVDGRYDYYQPIIDILNKQ